jgi:hypothetical protein
MSNPKSPAWYGGGISTICGDQPGIGDVFYVDGTNGLDTNDGLTPSTPVLTITYALSLCTAGENDYIIVLGYPGDAGEAVWPIPVNVSKVHIIGTPAQAAPSPFINATGNFGCFTISASNVEIAGLEFSCGVSAAEACIATSGGVWKGHIHHNFFAWQDAAVHGIYLSNDTDSVDCPHWHIHDNRFGDKMTGHNIFIAYNSTRTIIEDNLFFGVASGASGIYVDQAGANVGAILDNVFKVADAGDGEAIEFVAGTAGTVVSGNVALEGTVAMTQEPYRDLGSNHWGVNWKTNAVDLPKTT